MQYRQVNWYSSHTEQRTSTPSAPGSPGAPGSPRGPCNHGDTIKVSSNTLPKRSQVSAVHLLSKWSSEAKFTGWPNVTSRSFLTKWTRIAFDTFPALHAATYFMTAHTTTRYVLYVYTSSYEYADLLLVLVALVVHSNQLIPSPPIHHVRVQDKTYWLCAIKRST